MSYLMMSLTTTKGEGNNIFIKFKTSSIFYNYDNIKHFYNELKSYFTLPFTMTIVDNIHYVDDKVLGYRGGYFFWLGLYIVNITILSVDSTTGHQREYLTNTSLMGCLSLVTLFEHKI